MTEIVYNRGALHDAIDDIHSRLNALDRKKKMSEKDMAAALEQIRVIAARGLELGRDNPTKAAAIAIK